MESKTVLILGGGFAGLGAAVFLDSLGYHVTVLERKPILGGRTYAFLDKKTGHWVDNGQHLMMGAYEETLKLIGLIGATRHLDWRPQAAVDLILDNGQAATFSLARLPSPFNLLGGLLRLKALGWKDKFLLFRLGRELQKMKKGKWQDLGLTVDQWLTKMGQSARARHNFWDLLTWATLNDDPAIADSQMLAAVLVKAFLGKKYHSSLILCKTNLNELLAKPAKTYLELRGHTVTTGTPAKKIHILDNRVQGVELESGEMLRADWYVSAVPFKSLLNLIPDGFLNTIPYFQNLKSLKSAPIVSINLWFDREILKGDFVGLAKTQVHWYFDRNRIENRKGAPYHIMGVISGAHQFLDQSKEEILKKAMEELKSLFPQASQATLIHSLINKEREATLSPVIGAEALRPKQQSPFENFLVVGDWTKTELPATIESAVLSARLASEIISSSDQTHLQSDRPAAR